ncbi:peptidoglycan-binding protein [Sphaerisporangium rufum]|uniref:Peptidoglycan-binding protein n=1 Tax=Sphaerisporangium rufum TaxID=1381558 RepID=A0A919R490_9ACTN|nr:peptidoglycan-binding protein [Sphaerisporangium rufum]GII79404.1 peptidoglycan-binding protein [Sphaerisporangium rufum]
MRRGVLAAVTLGAVLAGAGAVGAATLGGAERSAAPARPPAPTAGVERGDLVDTVSVSGRLTYSGERKIATGGSGTVTWVPRAGATIRQGGALIRLDRRPVVLLYGAVPLYRTLRQGVTDGPDVRQLEKALKALGFGRGVTVDRHFSWATRQAVLRWQKHHGMARTGEVDAAQAVFLPGPARVAEARAAVGDTARAGGQALTVTGTRQVARVDLDVARRHLVRGGGRVTVELPGGKTVKGKITAIGGAVKVEDAGGQEGKSTVEVEISLPAGKARGLPDQAPVAVTLVSERRRDVLSVPVEALLALRDGGYGVTVVDPGGARRTVSVRTGGYGGGRVEVAGPGLAAGTKVEVPAE